MNIGSTSQSAGPAGMSNREDRRVVRLGSEEWRPRVASWLGRVAVDSWMFYAADRNKLRHAMSNAGLEEVRFRFEFEGTRESSFVNTEKRTASLPGGFLVHAIDSSFRKVY